MPKTTLTILFFLTLLTGLLAYNYYFQPFYQQLAQQNIQSPSGSEFMASESANLSAVELVFNRFTTQDRVGQLLAWPVKIDESGEIASGEFTQADFLTELSKKRPGTLTLFGDQISTISAGVVIDKLRGRNGSVLPAWIAVDHEGGKVQRLNGEGFTRLSSWRNICSADRVQAEQVLMKSAQELKSIGVNVILAPVLDVGLPRGAMGDRLCSNDPKIIVDRVGLFTQTFKSQGMWPVVKHFPGIGKITTDLHAKFAVGRVGVEDVFVYRSVLDKDAELGVMSAHIGLENQFSQLPCSLSPDCVGELTNNYPTVLVFADALEMKSAAYLPKASQSATKKELTLGEVSYKAVMAGNNVLLYGPGVTFAQLDEVYDMLNRSYNSDPAFKEKVDQSVKKIIGYKLGLINHETETSNTKSE